MTLEPESAGRVPSDMEAQTRRADVAAEDGERAIVYRLLATALEAPVGRDWLEVVGALPVIEGPLGAALQQLSAEARVADPEALRRDYHDLFIGVGRGELVPYASYYLTGFLNEKPLALLRQEMRRLGIERSPDVSEPEDHIAALCEMMAGLVEGAYGDGDPTTASTFFRAHVAAWAPYFFKDLAGTSTSALYAALGQSGRVFIDLEDEADRLFSQQRQAG
ncbi:TorD/DmsD family molecular chaperone [Stappia sp.]|jgi:TorA maturation chaperone TorD|uniref:TorD/DmsD family molecular chaperone n=1 Tax=Stappia sp. TaxID=1870903 RepID=UPI003D150FCB